ncbi:MAG: hypothetical protein NT028_00190 [candidate division Zixibacteria bacterium]|nr:hypothetical protein [candidate division Zixibacteria bacterium]
MKTRKIHTWTLILLFSPLILAALLVFSPFIAFIALKELFYGLRLRRSFYAKWGIEGRFALFVYSNSPKWQAYVKEQIIPKIAQYTVTLNWSKRADWKTEMPLEAKIFKHFKHRGEGKELPLAIILLRWRRLRVVGFYKAFKEHNRGNDNLLEQQEDRLYHLIEKKVNK